MTLPSKDSDMKFLGVTLQDKDGFTIPLLMPTPSDELLNSSDLLYLQSVASFSDFQLQHHNIVALKNYTTIRVRSKDMVTAHGYQPECDVVILPWHNFHMSSKAIQYAVLTLASSRIAFGDKNPKDDGATWRYLDKFYKYTREAIQEHALAEIVIACYTAILYHCNTVFECPDSFEAMLIHLGGLAKAMITLKSRGTTTGHEKLFDELWAAAFHLLQHIYWALAEPNPRDLQCEIKVMEKVHDVFQTFATLNVLSFVTGPAAAYKSVYTPMIQFRKRALWFYLDYYLALRKQGSPSLQSPTATFLRCLLRDIQIETAGQGFQSRSSHFPMEDGKVALLGAFAKLLEDTLFINTENNHQTIQSAYTLYQVCQMASLLPWSQHHSQQLTRYLFWVGLFLTKNIDATGRSALHRSLTV